MNSGEKTQRDNGIQGAQDPLYSLGEEVVHAISHGIGIPLSIAALVLLVAFSALYGNVWHVASTAIYGTTLILLYTASTLYHVIPHDKARPILQKLDHAAIYLLIAGTYTPFTLVTLNGGWGWTLFGMAWGLAVAGIWMVLWGGARLQRLSLALYLLMGWLVVIAIEPLIDSIENGGLVLLVAGGLSYTIGAGFYAWERLKWNHAIWHLFVLGGSMLHFFAVFFYVVPGANG